MAISRADRRRARKQRAIETFGDQADLALDLLELTELAWHDCYAEVSPPDDIIEDIFVCADGKIDELIRAAKLAVEDRREVKLWAQDKRSRRT